MVQLLNASYAHRATAVQLNVGFYVERLTDNVASIWYRALYPAVALQDQGHGVQVFDTLPPAQALASLDALIIVKVLGPKALSVALEARRLNTPVYLDLCDDIFVADYGGGEGREAAYFKACAHLASGVATTGPVMVETLRAQLGPEVPIWVLPDPAESAAFNARVQRQFRRWIWEGRWRKTWNNMVVLALAMRDKFIHRIWPKTMERVLFGPRLVIYFAGVCRREGMYILDVARRRTIYFLGVTRRDTLHQLRLARYRAGVARLGLRLALTGMMERRGTDRSTRIRP